MEDMEMTKMTNGAVITVSQPQVEQPAHVEPTNDTVTSRQVFSDPELGRDTPRDEAEMLFKSAKEEGFEEALTHLAEGDFNAVSDEKPAEWDETLKNGPVTKEVLEGDVEEVPEKEREELLGKIETLEEKVAGLVGRNEELQERLVKSEERAQLSQEMLFEMFKYLYELAKKEEDDKKKLSLFEVLLSLIAKFMITVVDPDAKIENEKKGTTVSGTKQKKSSSMDEMIKFLNEKGMVGVGNDVPNKTHSHASEPQYVSS
jgi:hypothetical protein